MPPFWSDASFPDPKRSYRWRATFVGDQFQHIDPVLLKSFQKPSFDVFIKEFVTMSDGASDLQDKEPRGLVWRPITITVVDTGVPDVTGIIYDSLKNSGYSHYLDSESAIPEGSMTKDAWSKSLGRMLMVDELDDMGKSISQWSIHEPLLASVEFGTLDYSVEDFVTITMTIQYDLATYKVL
jgi:hypothetical protein